MEYPVGILSDKSGFIVTELSPEAIGVNLKANISSNVHDDTSSTMVDKVKQKNILLVLIVTTVALNFTAKENRNVRQIGFCANSAIKRNFVNIQRRLTSIGLTSILVS